MTASLSKQEGEADMEKARELAAELPSDSYCQCRYCIMRRAFLALDAAAAEARAALMVTAGWAERVDGALIDGEGSREQYAAHLEMARAALSRLQAVRGK